MTAPERTTHRIKKTGHQGLAKYTDKRIDKKLMSRAGMAGYFRMKDELKPSYQLHYHVIAMSNLQR